MITHKLLSANRNIHAYNLEYQDDTHKKIDDKGVHNWTLKKCMYLWYIMQWMNNRYQQDNLKNISKLRSVWAGEIEDICVWHNVYTPVNVTG